MAAPLKDIEKFHAERRTGIGGSDAACLCGEDQFKTSYQLALEKIGMLQPDPTLNDNITIILGNKLEDDVAEIYAERNNVKVQRVNNMMRSKAHPFMILHPDRAIIGKPGMLEIKTSGLPQDWGQSGTDQIPNRVIIQCQHYMAVEPKLDYVAVAVLVFGYGQRYREYMVLRNKDFIKTLIEIEEEFWKNLQQRVLPEPDWAHPTTRPTLERLYKNTTGDIVTIPDIEHWTRLHREAADKRLSYEKLEESIKSHLLYSLGDAGVAPVPSGGRWVRRWMERDPYTVEGKRYMEFRFLKN